MEEGDNGLLIKFSDVAKLGGVANPAEGQPAPGGNVEKLGEVQLEGQNEVTTGNKCIQAI